MAQPLTTVAVVVPGTPTSSNGTPRRLMLVNPDGSAAGTVKKAPAQANSTATELEDLVEDFNALLAKLRSAGVISS